MNQKETSKSKTCCFCGSLVNSSIIEHVKSCKAKKSKCNNCEKMGHYERVCRRRVSEIELDNLEQEIQQIYTHNDYGADIFKIDLLKINVSNTTTNTLNDFKEQVILNSRLGKVLVDTGTKVSGCSVTRPTKWQLIEKMQLTQQNVEPFNIPQCLSKEFLEIHKAKAPILVEWYITEDTFELVLSAKQLVIVHFTPMKNIF